MAKFQDLSLEEQVASLEKFVNALRPSQLNEKTLEQVLAYVRDIPDRFLPSTFIPLLAAKFKISEKQIHAELEDGSSYGVPENFDDLVPKAGWLKDYMDYTSQTEPPAAFHFFAALTVLGATLARRIYFPRGSGDIFPNICAVLVAPPGKCKKTTACNLAVNLFRRIGGNVLADKITPEAIIESFKQQPTATGLIYAPEWSVFLGRQQYMEGLVPMLTALFDCPAVWSSTTIMRSTTQLQNVALSHLAATTIDWMQSSITKDAFAGGFMSRLLFVVQKNTPRSYALPPPLDADLGKKLVNGLLVLQRVNGSISLAPEAARWYTKWYTARQSAVVEKHFAGYFERKPDRLLQIAMVMNAAQDPTSYTLSVEMLRHAERILLWLERYLPEAFEELAATTAGDDQLRLLKQIRARNGEIKHSDWLRLNTSRMNSDVFKRYVETLMQAKLIVLDKTKHSYFLLRAGREQ